LYPIASLLDKQGTRKMKRAKSIFLWCPAFQVFRQVAGLASLLGVLRKMGSDFFKQTPPNLILFSLAE